MSKSKKTASYIQRSNSPPPNAYTIENDWSKEPKFGYFKTIWILASQNQKEEMQVLRNYLSLELESKLLKINIRYDINCK